MPRVRHLLPLLLVLASVAGCGGGASSDGLVDIGSGLRGPAGVRASVIATGLAHVAAMAVDAQGRTWVATATFEDTGADVVAVIDGAGAAPRTVLAGLHTPLGLLWSGDELYVAAKGGVVAHGGFDGARFATERRVLALPDDIGEVNGLAAHPDGRLLLGISAPCDHCTPSDARSGAILAFDPRSGASSVYASAIRAPIALTFAAGTNELYVTIDHRDDLGAQTPGDWLAIVAEGSRWGFPGCWGQGGAACEGVPAPVAALDPHAGLTGVALVRDGLGPALSDRAIVAEWAAGAVKQVVLAGARRGAVSPFVTGMRNPTAVVADATGALLLGDWTTGTIYRVARTA